MTARRSYGSGRLYVRLDANGHETYYGSWRVGGRRVKRRLGPKRRPGCADGLTRTQAEAELRRRIATETVIAGPQRRTVGEAYLQHLEHVMQRKRTTLQDYRGYLRRHLEPFFAGRPLDQIDRARVEAFMLAKLAEDLSPKTVQNLLNFLHGIFAFSINRQWATENPVALVDRPRSPRSAHRRIRFLRSEELDALLRAVPDDYLGAIERPLYLAAARPACAKASRWGCAGRTSTGAHHEYGSLRASRAAPLTHLSPITGARCRWPHGSPRSSSATSSARAGAATRTPCSRTPSAATFSMPPRCASASRTRCKPPRCG